MHPEDLKSRAAGALCVVGGATLTVWAWRSAIHSGHYGIKAALIGPTVLVLGVGLLIHGRGIPTAGASRLTRLYGVAGGIAAIFNLYVLGFFERPAKHRSVWLMESALPFALLFVWALPSRLFGGAAQGPLEEGTRDRGSPHTPIEPK